MDRTPPRLAAVGLQIYTCNPDDFRSLTNLIGAIAV